VASSPRLSVLKQRIDFLKLMKTGLRVRPCDWLLMNYASNPDGVMRCGWTLPRQVGPAVTRNRLKRWSRVYFRALLENGDTLPININLVFRKAESDFYKKLDYENFASVLDRGWKQIGRSLEQQIQRNQLAALKKTVIKPLEKPLKRPAEDGSSTARSRKQADSDD